MTKLNPKCEVIISDRSSLLETPKSIAEIFIKVATAQEECVLSMMLNIIGKTGCKAYNTPVAPFTNMV